MPRMSRIEVHRSGLACPAFHPSRLTELVPDRFLGRTKHRADHRLAVAIHWLYAYLSCLGDISRGSRKRGASRERIDYCRLLSYVLIFGRKSNLFGVLFTLLKVCHKRSSIRYLKRSS